MLAAFFVGVSVASAEPDLLTPANPMNLMAGPWTKAPADPVPLNGGSKTTITLEKGWFKANGAAFGLYPPVNNGVNQGVRAKFKYVVGGTADVAVRKHVDAQGVTHSYSLRLDETGLMRLVEFSNISTKNQIERKSLLQPEKKLAVKEGDEVLLELAAIGDELVAKVDGQLLGRVNGASLVPGKVHSYTSMMSVAELQWISLDGLPDARAKAVLGLAAAPPVAADAKPGALPEVPNIQGEPDVQKRVAEIDGKFRTLYEQLAGKAYHANLQQLRENYLAALKREELKAQQKGSLQEVLVYQHEAQAIAKTEPDAEPAALVKTMHDTYQKAAGRLETERNKLSLPAYEAYAKALVLYTAELTKAGRIEAAKLVDEVLQSVKKTMPGAGTRRS